MVSRKADKFRRKVRKVYFVAFAHFLRLASAFLL